MNRPYKPFCLNCGKYGHINKKCKYPVTSFGIIFYTVVENTGEIKYLLIQRKDTPCYVEFLLHKWHRDNIEYIKRLVAGLTCNEKKKLLCCDFDTLRGPLMYYPPKINKEYYNAKSAFEDLKNGYTSNGEFVKLENLIRDSDSTWMEPEWGFPKGRRNRQESDLQCAIRESYEETGLNQRNYEITNIDPIQEIFIGTNGIRYRHIYYVAKTKCQVPIFINPNNIDQVSEVGKIGWFNYQDAIDMIRPYHLEKKKILSDLNALLVSDLDQTINNNQEQQN